jgi:hypothetical protein
MRWPDIWSLSDGCVKIVFSTHTTSVARVAGQSADAVGIRNASQDQLSD